MEFAVIYEELQQGWVIELCCDGTGYMGVPGESHVCLAWDQWTEGGETKFRLESANEGAEAWEFPEHAPMFGVPVDVAEQACKWAVGDIVERRAFG